MSSRFIHRTLIGKIVRVTPKSNAPKFAQFYAIDGAFKKNGELYLTARCVDLVGVDEETSMRFQIVDDGQNVSNDLCHSYYNYYVVGCSRDLLE